MTESVTSTSTSSSGAGWRAVAASCDLAKGEVIPASLDGIAIAVWRSTDGEAHAWFDRCPHRGMRLSHGSASDAGLVCPYHGWRFGADTQCNHIPAHPQAVPPKAAKAREFSLVEAGGHLWANVGTDVSAAPSDDATLHPVRSLFVATDAPSIVSSLMKFPLDPKGVRKTPLADGESNLLNDGTAFTAKATSELRVDAQWSNSAGDDVSYTALIQPMGTTGCMVHLSTSAPLSKELAASMNTSLVALRDWISFSASSQGAKP